jgi:hypothetical protein
MRSAVRLECQSDVAGIERLEAENAELIETGFSSVRRGARHRLGMWLKGLVGSERVIVQCERVTQRSCGSERRTRTRGPFSERSRLLCLRRIASSMPTCAWQDGNRRTIQEIWRLLRFLKDHGLRYGSVHHDIEVSLHLVQKGASSQSMHRELTDRFGWFGSMRACLVCALLSASRQLHIDDVLAVLPVDAGGTAVPSQYSVVRCAHTNTRDIDMLAMQSLRRSTLR